MYKVKYAKSTESKVLGKIHSESWKVAYKDIIPDEVLDNITAEKRAAYFKKAISEGLEEDAIIYENDTPLGFICIGRCRDKDLDDSYGEVGGIYLLPEFWNQGVGYKLLTWGINELKGRGYSKVSLWVLEENLRARKFYEKHGFKHDGKIIDIKIGKNLKEYRYIKDIK